jgi:hypothetical protein
MCGAKKFVAIRTAGRNVTPKIVVTFSRGSGGCLKLITGGLVAEPEQGQELLPGAHRFLSSACSGSIARSAVPLALQAIKNSCPCSKFNLARLKAGDKQGSLSPILCGSTLIAMMQAADLREGNNVVAPAG